MKNYFMKKAYDEALKAKKMGEVPVGAVIVKDNRIVGRGFNLKEETSDSTNHAEMMAIKQASRNLGTWRLTGCTMFVTLEPCPMCAGAIVNSRISKVIIGTEDHRMGACGSAVNLLQNSGFNHRTEIERGIMKDECSKILTDFFRELRQYKSAEKKLRD